MSAQTKLKVDVDCKMGVGIRVKPSSRWHNVRIAYAQWPMPGVGVTANRVPPGGNPTFIENYGTQTIMLRIVARVRHKHCFLW